MELTGSKLLITLKIFINILKVHISEYIKVLDNKRFHKCEINIRVVEQMWKGEDNLFINKLTRFIPLFKILKLLKIINSGGRGAVENY